MGIFAVWVSATSHKVKKTDNWNVQFLFVRVSAVSFREFAFGNWVVDTWVFSEVMWISAFGAIGAIVFVIKFFAGLFRGFGSLDLSSESVWEMAAESVLAVTHVVVDAWIKASIDVLFVTVLLSFALFNWKVLLGAKVLDHFELAFKFFELKEFFVVHLCWSNNMGLLINIWSELKF